MFIVVSLTVVLHARVEDIMGREAGQQQYVWWDMGIGSWKVRGSYGE
jgi:hypothetical protein